MNDPLALIQAHPYISAALAVLIAVLGHRNGWWSVLLAKLGGLQTPLAPQPKAEVGMAAMPAPFSILSEVRNMIRRELDERLPMKVMQDAMPDPGTPAPGYDIADDAHTALELARRHGDQHELLTKVAADLIKKAADKPAA